MSASQQQISTDRLLLEVPATWPARRDYRRTQQLARTLGLEDCQAIFLDKAPRSAASYRWGLYYPLASVPLLVAMLLILALTPAATVGWLAALLGLLLLVLFFYISIALTHLAFRRTLLHCEQIHLYANGFVVIDPRGRRQGARWEQLFDFRRGSHENDRPSGRLRWNTIRSAIANPCRGQRFTLKLMTQLPDNTEICARIERAYTAFWLPRFWEQFAAGETLDFDALLLQRDSIGKTRPGHLRFSASLPYSSASANTRISTDPGMARGLLAKTDAGMSIEWLRRAEVKSIRIDERFILIRTVEPVRRDSQGRADRL